MEDDLSKLQALTPADRWNTEDMDALFLTVREKNTKVQEHLQALWTNHLEAVKEHDGCDAHGNPGSKHRVELSLKPMQIQSSIKHAEFRSFKKSFCNFLHASGLGEADGGSKLVLAHLRSCIKDTFLIKLEAKEDPTTASHLYTMVEKYIDKSYPLILKRLKFCKLKQDQN